MNRDVPLYGMPCGVCGLPAHHQERYPNGARIVHMEQMNRPCDVAAPRPPMLSESFRSPQSPISRWAGGAPVRLSTGSPHEEGA